MVRFFSFFGKKIIFILISLRGLLRAGVWELPQIFWSSEMVSSIGRQTKLPTR